MEKLIIEIEQEMINLLNNMQMEELHKVLLRKLQGLAFINKTNTRNLENEEVDLVFERYYEYLPKELKIDFHTILKVDGASLENHVLLHPIKSQELVELLKKSGFINIKTFGSFNKDEYDPMNSFPLIVVAQI